MFSQFDYFKSASFPKQKGLQFSCVYYSIIWSIHSYKKVHIFHHYLWVKFWIYLVKPHCRTHQGQQVYVELAEHTHVFPSSPNNDVVVDGNLVKFSQCKFGWSIKKINPWSYRWGLSNITDQWKQTTRNPESCCFVHHWNRKSMMLRCKSATKYSLCHMKRFLKYGSYFFICLFITRLYWKLSHNSSQSRWSMFYILHLWFEWRHMSLTLSMEISHYVISVIVHNRIGINTSIH